MSAQPVKFQFQGESAQRLDRVLLAAVEEHKDLAGYSRSQLQRWIEDGQIRVNEKARVKPGSLVQPGSQIEIVLPETEVATIESSGRALEILYQDGDVMVINKPAGLSVHPGAGRMSDTLVHAIVGYLTPEERATGIRPGIVHRLDLDTTGIVVVAKTVQAHYALSRQFAGKTTEREYSALVFTTPRSKRAVSKADAGIVDTQIGRNPKQRLEMAVIPKNGKRAVTHWRAIERTLYATLLAVTLETGRTHQIRVHMAHLGSPVLGDKTYGDFSGLPPRLKALAERFGRQALHARMLAFTHPSSGKRMRFEKDPPADFMALVEEFRKWKA